MEEPVVIWLSGLHIPESYLIAHIQIACRLYTWPLDRSTQFTRVTGWVSADEIEERPVTVLIFIDTLLKIIACAIVNLYIIIMLSIINNYSLHSPCHLWPLLTRKRNEY